MIKNIVIASALLLCSQVLAVRRVATTFSAPNSANVTIYNPSSVAQTVRVTFSSGGTITMSACAGNSCNYSSGVICSNPTTCTNKDEVAYKVIAPQTGLTFGLGVLGHSTNSAAVVTIAIEVDEPKGHLLATALSQMGTAAFDPIPVNGGRPF